MDPAAVRLKTEIGGSVGERLLEPQGQMRLERHLVHPPVSCVCIAGVLQRTHEKLNCELLLAGELLHHVTNYCAPRYKVSTHVVAWRRKGTRTSPLRGLQRLPTRRRARGLTAGKARVSAGQGCCRPGGAAVAPGAGSEHQPGGFEQRASEQAQLDSDPEQRGGTPVILREWAEVDNSGRVTAIYVARIVGGY